MKLISDDIEVPILRKLTKADVIEYFDKHFAVNSSGRRKLCTMVYSNTETEDAVSKREREASGDTEHVSSVSFIYVLLDLEAN